MVRILLTGEKKFEATPAKQDLGTSNSNRIEHLHEDQLRPMWLPKYWKFRGSFQYFRWALHPYMGIPQGYFCQQVHFDREIVSTNKRRLGRAEKVSWSWKTSGIEGLLKFISAMFKQNEGKKVGNCTRRLSKCIFILLPKIKSNQLTH